jgi:required for meiotic nuclear division protein 1
MKIIAFYIAEDIALKQLKEAYAGTLLQENPSELYYRVDEAGYCYITDYGAVVFGNVSDADASKNLQFIQQYCVDPLPEKLREDFEVTARANEPLSIGFGNLVVPEITENVVKIVMLNLAYSVAMDFYTQRAQEQLVEIQQFTRQMETEGTIHISRKNMVRFIGKALNNKNRIVENLYIFDSPDLAWDDEYLDKIHRGMTRTFEIQSRFKELEYNFKVIEDNLAVFRDFFLHRESSKLEWIIIVLICIEVFDLIISKLGAYF